MIREVCIAINNFTSNPKIGERTFIAKQLVGKYPCLADKSPLASSEWGYLQVKIFDRMKKMKCPKRLAGVLGNGHHEQQTNKRQKTSPNWCTKPDLPEGEELEKLQKEREELRKLAKKTPNNNKAQKEFMEKTYTLRRSDILSSPKLVADVLLDYPPLGKFTHLRAEMCRILDDDELPTKLREKFKMWQQRILKFAAASKDNDVKEAIEEMQTALTEDGCDSAEIQNRATFVIIKSLKQRSGKKKGPLEECFTILKRNANVEKEIERFIQPQIVIVGGNLYNDVDLVYIVAEGSIICSIPQCNIVDAVTGLLGCFYVFNISYTYCKSIFNFLEQALLEIGRGQTLVSVTSFFNALAHA